MDVEETRKLAEALKALVDTSPCTPVEIYGVLELTKFYVRSTVKRVTEKLAKIEKPGGVS